MSFAKWIVAPSSWNNTSSRWIFINSGHKNSITKGRYQSPLTELHHNSWSSATLLWILPIFSCERPLQMQFSLFFTSKKKRVLEVIRPMVHVVFGKHISKYADFYRIIEPFEYVVLSRTEPFWKNIIHCTFLMSKYPDEFSPSSIFHLFLKIRPIGIILLYEFLELFYIVHRYICKFHYVWFQSRIFWRVLLLE